MSPSPPRTGAAALRAWLEKRAERAGELVAVEEALLAGRFPRYALRRLAAFTLARGWGIALHLVELTWLAAIFSAKQFVASIALSNLALVVDALYFGALEGLRRRARELGPGTEAAALTSRWLTAAVWLGVAVVVLPAGKLAWDLHDGPAAPSLFVVYALLCAARLSADIVLRTYYSGVFAFHRVYRPLALPLVAPTVGVGLTVLLWSTLGGYSFPVALLASVGLSRALLLVYTRRAYRLRRIPPPRLRLFPRGRRSKRRPLDRRALRMGLLAGAANTTTRLGGVVLIAAIVPSLADSADELGQVEPLAYALHLAAPLLLLAGQWSLVFYHDWKRLEADDAAVLARHLHRRLLVTAVLVALVAWLAASALVSIWVPLEQSGRTLAALLPATLGLSTWTALQLRGFSHGEFVRQAASAGAMLLVLWVALSAEVLGRDAWYVALAGGPWAAVALSAALGAFRDRRAHGLVGTVATWAKALDATRGPIAVWEGRAAQHPSRAAARLAERLGERGALVRMGSRLLWFEREGQSHEPSSRATWLAVTAGALSELSGRTGVTAREAHAWLEARGRLARPAPRADLDALARAHQELFPEGFVLRVGKPAPARYRALAPATRQAIWHDALRAQRRNRGKSGWFITAYAPSGATEALFAAPRPVTTDKAAAWHAQMAPHGWRIPTTGAHTADRARGATKG